MFLREFGSHDDWDREAALQCLLVIKALYIKDVAMIGTVAAPENTVPILHLQTTYTWPPRWVVFRAGDNRFHVIIAGTTNSVQMGYHIVASGVLPLGAVKDLNYKTGAAQPNLPWNSVAIDILNEIVDVIGDPPANSKWYFSGHSYGGAVAQLLGHYMIKSYAKDSQVMVFGSPKVWTEPFPGPFPDVYWRIESEGDVVTISPSQVPDLGPVFINAVDLVAGKKPENRWDWIALRWTHYGKSAVIYADGGLVPPPAPVVPLPKYVSTSLIAKHLPNNYFGRVLANAGGG